MALMKAGEKAVSCGVSNVSEIEELSFVKDLHQRFDFINFPFCCFKMRLKWRYSDKLSVVFNLFRTTRELEVDPSVISGKNSSRVP